MTDETIELASEPIITVHDDMTVTVETETHIAKLKNVNPTTQNPWLNAKEAKAFAETRLSDPNFLQLKSEKFDKYQDMTFNAFVFYVKTIGGMTAKQAMEILSDSVDDDIRLIRVLLMTPGIKISRNSSEVVMGLDVLIGLEYINEAGKIAILDNWPAA